MNQSKKFYGYGSEINKLAATHTEAILALYLAAFNDGMQVGRRNALIRMSVGAVAGLMGLCIAVITYLEHKEQLLKKEEP